MSGSRFPRWRVGWGTVLLLLAVGLAGCTLPLGAGGKTASASPCARTVTPEMMGLHLEPVTQLPYLAGQGATIKVELFGRARARQQAEALLAVPTFCDEALPEAIAAVLEQARAALKQGNTAEALRLIRSLLHPGVGGRSPGLAYSQRQTHPDWRARISATIQFAEELALEGDQAGYDQVMSEVMDYFGEQATQALEQADFREALRIAEEAMLLGRQDVAEQATEIIRDKVRQAWEQTVAGFSPCISDPDRLREAMRQLIEALAKAQFFGVPGAVDGEMYNTTIELFERAKNNLEAMGRGEPPKCGYRGAFTLSGATGFATLTGTLRSCTGTTGPWEAQAHLVFDDSGGFGHCEGDVQWTFTLDPNTQTAEGMVSVTNLVCVPPADGCTYPSVSESLRFKAQAQGEALMLTMSSSGQGHIVIYCPDPEEPFRTEGPMALFWGLNEVPVTLVSDETCP